MPKSTMPAVQSARATRVKSSVRKVGSGVSVLLSVWMQNYNIVVEMVL